MAGATRYRFDGGGSSDEDGDSLTYSWDFGDGNSGSGSVATHVYEKARQVQRAADGKRRVESGRHDRIGDGRPEPDGYVCRNGCGVE